MSSDGAETLDAVRDFIRRFCAFTDEHCLAAVTLWAAHTHVAEHLHTTPRLAILSPEAGSGKTRVLEILELLVPDPMFTVNASPAAIFRTLAKGLITLLFDEVDAIWNQRGRDDSNEDLRALLNSGYKLGAKVPRCIGKDHQVELFPTFCPVALAGLGNLPDTIMSRSVIIRMRRRAPHETVEPYRARMHEQVGHAKRAVLADWCSGIAADIGETWPQMPAAIVDRPQEVWEPLVMLADAAGGHWPATARAAAVHLCNAAQDNRVSLGVRLLGDLRTIYRDDDKLATSTIIERLVAGNGLDDDAPWGDLRGRPITDRKLANLLRPYGIKSKNVQIGTTRPKGYTREDLFDAWARYLPQTSGSPLHPLHGHNASNGAVSNVAEKSDVADGSATSEMAATPKASSDAGSADVALVADFQTTDSACPACAGEGCRRCGDTGRNPELL